MTLKMSPDPIIVVLDFDETIAHFDDENLLAGPNRQPNAEPLLYVRREIFHFLHELRSWWGRQQSLVVIWSRGDDCYIQEAVHSINGLASHIDIVWGESQCRKSFRKYGLHKSVDYLLQHSLVIKWLTGLRNHQHQSQAHDNGNDHLPHLIVPTTVIIDDKADENAVGSGNLYHYTWTIKPISRFEVAAAQSANGASASLAANNCAVGHTKLVLVPIICDLIACLCWQQTCNPLMIPILHDRDGDTRKTTTISNVLPGRYLLNPIIAPPTPAEVHQQIDSVVSWGAMPKSMNDI